MAASPEAFEVPSLHRAWDQVVRNVGAVAVMTAVLIVLSILTVVVYCSFYFGSLVVSGGDYLTTPNALAGLFVQLLGEGSKVVLSIAYSFFAVMMAAIPAVYFATGEVITAGGAFRILFGRFWRHLGAGVLFSLAVGVGWLFCLLPGLVVALTYPIFVNKIFTTDQPVLDAFGSSFKALYGSPEKWSFLGIQVLAWLLVLVVTFCTCGLGGLVAVPVSTFFIQNAAYRWGLLS